MHVDYVQLLYNYIPSIENKFLMYSNNSLFKCQIKINQTFTLRFHMLFLFEILYMHLTHFDSNKKPLSFCCPPVLHLFYYNSVSTPYALHFHYTTLRCLYVYGYRILFWSIGILSRLHP